MAEDEFTKLFQHMNQRFDQIDGRFDIQDKKFGEVLGAIAELAADVKSYHEELLHSAKKSIG